LTYSAWFEALRDLPEVEVLLYFPYLAPWLSDNDPLAGFPIPAAPHPPNDLVEYREFLVATLRYLVKSVGLPPERIIVEVMNEPDLRCGADPVTACFWDNWTMADIADVVQATYDAVQSVDADIELVGLAECCGTAVVRKLLDQYSQGQYLDGLSYHYYSGSGYNLDPALRRAAELAPYRRPLYLDEYGSRQFLSEGRQGALWHSWALVTLWEAGIAPLQYPISEFPLIGDPYSSMGLSENWSGDWLRKPSHWVYANFFRHMDGGDVLAHVAPANLDVMITRRVSADEAQVAFWVVNRGNTSLPDQSFAVSNFPEQKAILLAYDNLASPTPASSMAIAGSPLIFTATLPARSSYTFVLRGGTVPGDLDRVVLSPQVATRLAGQPIPYAVTAYDSKGGSWDVTPSSAYAIDPSAGGTWLDNVYTTDVAGAWNVTGTYASKSNTGSLEVRIPASGFYLPLVEWEEDVSP
jgi:hypothetical protein